MLRDLKRLAEGFDPRTGQPVDRETQMRAMMQWREMSKLKAETHYIDAQAAATTARVEIDRQNAKVQNEVALRDVVVREQRLQLEVQELTGRLEIEKARVFVDALRVAVAGGVQADDILLALEGLNRRLGGGGTPPQLENRAPTALLEKKKD